MNKGQLIDKVSKEFNLDRASAKQLVECLFRKHGGNLNER
jgi:nucleoid DNA-binding protein